MDFSKRSYQKELLDRDDIPFDAIKRNMEELDLINSWLGGHTITIAGFKNLAGAKKKVSICEIGCGGGDNLMAIAKWCRKKNIEVRLAGIDINPDCIAIAASRVPDGEFMISDYRDIDFGANKPDIIFSSLFCHHFRENELVNMLRWMRSHSGIGFFINDLHRHPLAYYSIRSMTAIFSRSYLVKNDAPLSVLRGFKKKEWEQLLYQAGMHGIIQWRWAFRWLLILRNDL